MAVTVIDRPLGHVLDTTENDACIYDDYGSAIVFAANHGLSTGDYVYIKSNVSTYNGFWYVVFNNGSSFYIREYPTASNLTAFVDTCEVTYQASVYNHGYQCVHLPIVYQLRSNLWPTNEVDTSRTISSISDDNGLCNLNLSGSLGTFDELEYVKISSNDDFSDEVYQVVDKVSSSDITINRAYESGLSTAGTIILYYNNYSISVRIYGGLNTNHFWTAQKPYALLTTLKVTPEESNIATINIAEILKTKISPTENSTLSPYLPNNLDFFTQFYISTGESYDDAVNGEVVESTVTFISDQDNFEGNAVNSMLAFKNIHSGHLSAYIYADENNLIKFLTTFNPIFFTGEYFDISFINNLATVNISTFQIKRDVYIDDVLKETFYDQIGNRSEGIYRKQIEQSGWSEDRIDLTVQASGVLVGDGSVWQNYGSGNEDWTIDGRNLVSGTLTIAEPGASSGETRNTTFVLLKYDINSGTTYNWVVRNRLTADVTVTGGTSVVNSITLSLYYLDTNYAVVNSATVRTISESAGGNQDSTLNTLVTLAATGNATYIAFRATHTYTASSEALIMIAEMTAEVEYIVTTNLIDVSETKTITVNSDCASQDIYLGWLNYLGGFEYWKFTARKDYIYDVEKSQITEKNIYTNWPQSYGEFANSVTKQISRDSRKKIRVRSQFLTTEQLEGIKFIRFSPLVQVIEDKYNVTNVVVDSGSFKTFTDAQDLNTIEFTISFTDQIPSQFE